MIKKKYFASLLACIAINLILVFQRNNWYASFYTAINNKHSLVYSINYFLLIAFFIFCIDYIKGFVRIHFVNESIESFVLNEQERVDSAQRICEDKKLQALNFFDALDFFFSSIFLLLVFGVKLFFMMRKSALYIMIVLFVYMFLIFLINFKLFKVWIQKAFNDYSEKEALLRSFLSSFLNKNCVRPIAFDWQKFAHMQNAFKQWNTIKLLNETLRGFYESIGLILPFALFYSFYCNSLIDFGVFMQLINIWTQMNYAIILFARAMNYYFNYEVSRKRSDISQRVVQNDCNAIILEKIEIVMRGKKIVQNFSLHLEMGNKLNVIAAHSCGKTSIMQAMQGFRKFKGKIFLPHNVLWIPEQPIMPLRYNFEKTPQFLQYCKLIGIDSDIKFDQACGYEKWKLICAYALCFDFVVWDDPFWGLNAQEELARAMPFFRSVLFFSKTPIHGIDHILIQPE